MPFHTVAPYSKDLHVKLSKEKVQNGGTRDGNYGKMAVHNVGFHPFAQVRRRKLGNEVWNAQSQITRSSFSGDNFGALLEQEFLKVEPPPSSGGSTVSLTDISNLWNEERGTWWETVLKKSIVLFICTSTRRHSARVASDYVPYTGVFVEGATWWKESMISIRTRRHIRFVSNDISWQHGVEQHQSILCFCVFNIFRVYILKYLNEHICVAGLMTLAIVLRNSQVFCSICI